MGRLRPGAGYLVVHQRFRQREKGWPFRQHRNGPEHSSATQREKSTTPPPAAPSVMGSHEFEGDSGDGPYRVGSEILVTAIRNPFDDTKKWPMAELPNGTIARITCMPDSCVYIPYGSKYRARITGITNMSTSVAVLQIFE